MSDKKFYKEQSKLEWYTNDPISINQLSFGALQRIADATEKMASNYTALQNDLDWYKRKYKEKNDQIERMNRRISALRGVITKMKKSVKHRQIQSDTLELS